MLPSFSKSIVEELHWNVAKDYGMHVFIKRDDLIHPIISGNKWRKLHLHLPAFQKSKKKTILTFGGAYSNHILATACAGYLYNIPTIGIVRGEEIVKLSDQLSLCSSYGMKLNFVSREEYRDKDAIIRNYKEAYCIKEGGAGELGVKGSETILDEIGKDYDYIILPIGTGTTLEGICRKANKNTKIIGISALKGMDYEDVLEKYPNLAIIQDEEFGGYAKYNIKLINFIDSFYKETSILIDPIYQGKLYYKINQLLGEGYFKKGSKMLFIHTGGEMGLYSDKMRKLIL